MLDLPSLGVGDSFRSAALGAPLGRGDQGDVDGLKGINDAGQSGDFENRRGA